MPSAHIFRMGGVKGKNGVLIASKHNKRETQNERGTGAHINALRTPLNYSLTGMAKAEQIDRTAKVLMVEAGIDRLRKNGIMAVEVIYSLPIERHQQDTRPFFKDSLEWTKQNIPGVLLSFDVHLDESAPHAHALILPLVDGKMQGSNIMGGKGDLLRRINKFYADVACRYGLSRNENRRLSSDDRTRVAKQVVSLLAADPAVKSAVWPCIRDAIYRDPLPYAGTLGIENKQQTTEHARKSFVQIMTSKGKGKITNPI